jgi:hypothetical protein
VRTFRPGLWITGTLAYGAGAASTIDGQAKNDRREDAIGALALGLPLTRRVGWKLAYVGQRARESVGADSDTFSLTVSGQW